MFLVEYLNIYIKFSGQEKDLNSSASTVGQTYKEKLKRVKKST